MSTNNRNRNRQAAVIVALENEANMRNLMRFDPNNNNNKVTKIRPSLSNNNSIENFKEKLQAYKNYNVKIYNKKPWSGHNQFKREVQNSYVYKKNVPMNKKKAVNDHALLLLGKELNAITNIGRLQKLLNNHGRYYYTKNEAAKIKERIKNLRAKARKEWFNKHVFSFFRRK